MMKLLTISICGVLVLSSCADVRLGLHSGVDVPLVRTTGTGEITESSVGTGISSGISCELIGKKSWGVRFGPQFRTTETMMKSTSTLFKDSLIAVVESQFTTEAQFFEFPVLMTINPFDSTMVVQPYFSAGAMLSLAMDATSAAQGARTIYTQSGTATSEASIWKYGPSEGDAYLYLLYSGGIRYLFTKSFEIRLETRLQHLLTDNYLARYDYQSSLVNNEIVVWPSVSATIPTLTFGLSFNILFRL